MSRYAYLRKYACTDDTWQPWTSPATIQQAGETIDAICQRKDVSIPMLQSVVSLTAHPRSLHILNNTNLIQACVLRLHTRQRQDPQYPFGSEDGYLCFRILVLATGVALVSRSQHKYGIIIEKLLTNERLEDLSVLFMDYVSGCVNEICANEMIYHVSGYNDTFLGWNSPKVFEPFISKANAAILLNVLYRDRKGFLRAWAETHAPALSGLLFTLWRCARIASTPDRWISFCEIHWRNYIVTCDDHLGILKQYSDDASARYEHWLTKSTLVDLEDARTALHALTQRLASTSILYPLPDLTTIETMVSWVVPRTGLMQGVEDLFIPFLRVTFDFFWVTVAGKSLHTYYKMGPEDVASTIYPASVMIKHLNQYAPERAKDFAQATAELGVIEILARGFALVKKEPECNEESKYSPLILTCHNFMIALLDVGPPTYRETAFADAFVEWFKTLRYMRARDGIFNTRTQHTNWYSMCDRTWIEVGDVVEYDTRVARAEAMSSGCAYARCPDPDSVKGVCCECPCGGGVKYCGTRCQQMDWALNLPTSHRRKCTWVGE